jgi:hypothetical protein
MAKRGSCRMPRATVPERIHPARTIGLGGRSWEFGSPLAPNHGRLAFVSTDGVIGNLAGTDILSWTWTIAPSGGTPLAVSSSDVRAELKIEELLGASPSSITMAAAPKGGYDAFALLDGAFDFEYERTQEPGQTPIRISSSPCCGRSRSPRQDQVDSATNRAHPSRLMRCMSWYVAVW